MRSIYAKILAWAAATVALSSIGFVATFWYLSESRSQERRFFTGILTLQRDAAERAWRERGAEGLRAFLRETAASFEGDHYLLDRDGRDLLDGVDRSSLPARASAPGLLPPPPGPPCSSARPRPRGSGSWPSPGCGGSPGPRRSPTTSGSCC